MQSMLAARAYEARTGGTQDPKSGRYRKGFIEDPLFAALREQEELPEPERDYEIRKDFGAAMTVPDFSWPTHKVAVFCDGYAFHGDATTLELDAKKRNSLQARGWAVLVFWGRTLLRDPMKCAAEVAQVVRSRTI